MAIVKKMIEKIPLEELSGVDEFFFKQIQMNKDKALRRFKPQYLETKEKVYSQVSMTAIYNSYPIKVVEGDVIYLENGVSISSEMLARVIKESDELLVIAMTLSGYDSLEAEESDGMKTLFLDGWGTSLVEGGSSWIKKKISKKLEEEKLYTTQGWSPGQHNVDIKLQIQLFALLEPEEIGITLSKSYMMHPKKSISSFVGIGRTKDIENIRACDFCERKKTCPNAYA
ncbi:MAG: hypothetical protein RR963_04655 [Anaerovoracaceae bacterium]